jgi:hypothetical protein
MKNNPALQSRIFSPGFGAFAFWFGSVGHGHQFQPAVPKKQSCSTQRIEIDNHMKTRTNNRSFQGQIAALLAVSLFAVCGMAHGQNNSSRPPPQSAPLHRGGESELATDSNTPDDTYVTDGTVNAIVRSGNAIYIGGLFNRLGPRTGPGLEFALNGSQNPGLPEVSGGDFRVTEVVADGSGGWYIGGVFTHVGGIARNNLAHIRADRSVDPGFNPNANDIVNTLAVSTDGSTVYVGGTFTSVGGQPRNHIAALNALTGNATAFNPNPDGDSISTLAISGSIIYAGGRFSLIGGQSRNSIAALNAGDGTATLTFNPTVNSGNNVFVYSMAVSGSTLYVGGNFGTIGGQPRNQLAALTLGGPLDGTATSFNAAATMNGCDPCVYIGTIAVSNSMVYVGGIFSFIGGQSRASLAALDSTTGTATPFAPDPGSNVEVVAVSPDGSTVYAGGGFRNIGGQARTYVAALNAADGTATAFNPNPNGSVAGIGVTGSAVYLGGFFSSIGGVVRNSLAALDATTGVPTSFAPASNSTNGSAQVNALAVSGDGATVYVGGYFASFGGQPRTHLAALNAADGTATGWNPNADNIVNALALSGPLLYVGGNFFSIGGQPRNFIAALGVTDGLATAWDPNAFDGQVSALAVSGPLVYAGGIFTIIGGQFRTALAALNASDGSATAWHPDFHQASFNSIVHTIAVSGSTIYAGGYFDTVSGSFRRNIVAINATDGMPTAFNPSASGTLFSDSVDAIVTSGSKVYAGGGFLTIGGQSRNYLAELNASDGSATSFNPGASANGAFALTLAPDGTLYVGGDFRGFELAAQQGFAAFSTAAPALTGAVSRKTHGAAGLFDINLPATGTPGVECRVGAVAGAHQMIFTFATPVTVDGAAVTTGTGSATFGVSGAVVTVDLTGVTNAQTITVTLANVNDGTNTGNVPVSMGILSGDTNGSGSVSASDVAQTKAQSGNVAGAGNFRTDVNSSGTVNASDVALVKSRSGTVLP